MPNDRKEWIDDQENLQIALGFFFKQMYETMEAAVYNGIAKHFKKNNG